MNGSSSLDMAFSGSGTYYDVLDVSPSATPNEIREAYLRAKSAYNKDSVALYSLVDSSERENILRRIEEAYEILSNEDKRRQYDAHHGIIETSGTLDASTPDSAPPSNVVSIDRIPPMEILGAGEDLLVPPVMDIAPDVTPNPAPASITKAAADHYVDQGMRKAPPMNAGILQEILDESLWQGPFLRRVRDAQNVAIEEMSNITKVSKTYILAIESDDFKKLPALVFVRGFLIQICRVLKLPQEKVLDAYLQRFKAAKEKE